MLRLLKRFKKLSFVNQLKLVILFPVIVSVAFVDKIIDISTRSIQFMKKRHEDIIVLTILASMMIIYLFAVVRIDGIVPEYKGQTRYDAELYVYTYCHEMTNNFIVAKDGEVRGFVRADRKNIDRIIDVLYRNDIDSRYDIMRCLNEFKYGDYHSAVWLHNHCWLKLNGEVGYAIGLKDRYK